MGEWTDGQMVERMGWVNGQMDRWLKGWVNGQMDVWILHG